MTQFFIVTLNGLTLAALFFLVASGFSLIFGLMRVVNMMHGSLYILGAYLGYSIWDFTGSWVLALLVAPLLTAILGILLYQIFLRRIAGQDLREALVTIALSIIIADLLLAQYGGQGYGIRPPEMIRGATSIPILDFRYPTFRLFTLFSALGIGGALWFILKKTRLGIIIRAGIDNREIVSAMGINIQNVFIIVFGLGAMLAGVGGIYGISSLSVNPGDDGAYLLSSLIVVIIGGMGSLSGAALGALLVGLAGQYGLAYLPTYASLLTFVMMISVLAFRPQGLVGKG